MEYQTSGQLMVPYHNGDTGIQNNLDEILRRIREMQRLLEGYEPGEGTKECPTEPRVIAQTETGGLQTSIVSNYINVSPALTPQTGGFFTIPLAGSGTGGSYHHKLWDWVRVRVQFGNQRTTTRPWADGMGEATHNIHDVAGNRFVYVTICDAFLDAGEWKVKVYVENDSPVDFSGSVFAELWLARNPTTLSSS